VKVTRIGPDDVFHRYLTPRWAYLPTSGAGAADDGGRFNRPGVEALYLSKAPQTALEEYRQGASITPPATLAAYKLTLKEVAEAQDRAHRQHDAAQVAALLFRFRWKWRRRQAAHDFAQINAIGH
jgi:RES domain-containing protein